MNVKRIGGLLLLGFVIFFIIESPSEAASVVKTTGQSLGDVLSAMANAFSDFLSQLF